MKAGPAEATGAGAAGRGAAGAAGRSAATGAGAGVTTVGAAAVTGATFGAPAPGAGRAGEGAPGRAAVPAVLPPLPLVAPVAFSPPPLPAGVATGAGAATGNASFSLRTTGASIVEDALLTNSPNSLSLEMISLLDLPSSFASSCTRALPATALLTVRPGGRPARPLVSCTGSLLGLHGVLTTGRPAFDVRSERTPAAVMGLLPGDPDRRRARPNARRRSAMSRHPTWGCSHAPRPGRRRRGSGTRIPSTATMRSSVGAGAFSRHPMQVRRGVFRIEVPAVGRVTAQPY